MSYLNSTHLECLHKASKENNQKLQVDYTTRYETTYVSEDQPSIPDPSLFESSPLNIYEDNAIGGFPTVSQCAVHLELLEVFHMLRGQILHSKDLDVAFGVEVRKRTAFRTRPNTRFERRYEVQLRDNTWETRRQEKWSYFSELAAGRFSSWIRLVDGIWEQKSRPSESSVPIEADSLPPLDVLMVWHAFLLSPYDFDRYCKGNELKWARKVPFPWTHIHEAINSREWTYSLPVPIKEWLLEKGNMEPDLFMSLANVGKNKSHAYTLLSRYGNGGIAATSESTKYPLQVRELQFFRAIKSAMAQSEINRPLIENVKRQASFVDKMHAHLWIGSPAVAGTLRRAIDRYDKFVQLFKLHPGRVLVPTLDVDLVWHTHQCSAELYQAYMIEHTGKFIRHDDRYGKPKLDDSFQTTNEIFFARFGEEYHTCLCWNCEAILNGLEEADDEGRVMSAAVLARTIEKKVNYHAAVEIARRKGSPVPVRCL